MPNATTYPTSINYKILLLLLSPVALTYLAYRALKDGGWGYFTQRLGFNYSNPNNKPIVIHCASVGEVQATKPLVFKLAKQHSKQDFIISTNTPTAASLVRTWNHSQISHVYFPIDYAFAVNAFLNKFNPKCVLILETEIWPTFYYKTAKQNTPIAIINGRLSKRTLDASNFIKNEYQYALKNLSLLLARSEDDRLNYISLGADKNSTLNAGNLKYATPISGSSTLPCTTIKQPFILAASTHDDEEKQLAEHLELFKKYNFLLVIAPRYPDRGAQLSQQFSRLGYATTMHSNNDKVTDDCDIYIVDTLGELPMYYNEAAMVFVGGSLIDRGGHNILEPAAFGKCILVGPHTHNFEQEVQDLLAAEALIQVANNYELGFELIKLLKDEHSRAKYASKAAGFMQQKKSVIEDYIEHLKPLLLQN